ncbi:WW domain containing protein [Leishmania donovani]|uniref:WW domain family protein n=1 Tax=Leishmania donovani TaxID=5661 RepID=A0A504X7A7_LEIDO|nr:WW domain family protein [Leishmania donovani]CAJ1987020.1 WW domain containing protein [Leishmania donovani]VDZ42910.1 WW_domain_containing_protein_putative/Pfam:PF00397 [Leishmania donovani]
MSVVLEVQPDTGYEPSEAEMVEYGKWLGMELPDDTPLLWIAREGLKAPLPEHWKACKSEKGELYYFNFKTGQSIWDHPSDEHYRELLKAEKAKLHAKENGKGDKEVTPAASSKAQVAHSGKAAKKRRSKASDTEAHETKPKAQEAAGKTNSVKDLEPIQKKKELPESLKISTMLNDEGREDKGNIAAARMGSTELQSTASRSCSSLVSDAAKAPKIDEPDAIPLPSKVVAGGGVNGLRALDKLGTSSPEKVVTSSSKNHKAKVDQQVSKDLEEYRAQQQSNLKRQKEEIDAEVAEDLRRYQECANTKKQKRRAAIEKETADALKIESARLGAELESKLAALRQDYETKLTAESERLRSKLKAHLEHDKRKVEAEVAQMLEIFTREKRQESEIRKEAQSQAFQEAMKSMTDLKQFSSAFLHEYEAALAAFAKDVQESHSVFEQIGAQRQKQMQEEMDAKLAQMREEHDRHVQKAQDCASGRLETLRKDMEREAEELKQTQKQQLQRMHDEFMEQRSAHQKEQLSQDHERFMETLGEIKASQAKELEALKQQLKEKAQEELNAIMQELMKEKESRRSSLSVVRLAESHEPTPRMLESRSMSATDDDGDVGKGKAPPPHLDRKLLTRTSVEESAAGAAPAAAPQPDIKALVTEALREVFAGSPFILPSPQTGEFRTAPGTPAATASATTPSRSGQDFRSSNPAANLMPPALSGNPTKASGAFKLPLSFEEQRSLVEGERSRLQEGRKYVELQQQNLEERKQQLRRTRHQWKQDVLAAKREGVRSSSNRGQLLNKVRLTLEEQAQGLEHDMMILRDSQVWLLSKEQRLITLEKQIEEQERLRSRNGGEASALNNCSVDTAALMTGFFKPPRHSVATHDTAFHRDVMGYNALGSGSNLPMDNYAASPILSKALSRIERRLDEVTSIIHMQHQQTASQAMTPSHGHGNSRRHSTVSPVVREAVPGYVRRTSRSHSKSDALRRDTHLDQWQAPGI